VTGASAAPVWSRAAATSAAPSAGRRASGGLVLVSQRMVKLQPETSRLICQVLASELISIVRQPVLLAASRCYLIQMLRSALTCINGCSCWSPDEENSPRFFLTMDALYRLS
jgi:hypothetical protein